jgi:hypothetical protein
LLREIVRVLPRSIERGQSSKVEGAE